MAVEYSIQKMVSDGTLSTIALGIQYLQRNDIYMRIAGEETPQSGAPSGYTWSFVDNTTLKILPVVPNGVEVVVYRRTDIDAMYNIYSQNAQFDEATIDENNQQLLYIAQEYLEQGIPGAGVDILEFVRDDGINTYYRIKRTDGSYSDEFAVPSAGSITKILARESIRRSYAEAGFNLVDGSFETGGVLTSSVDVLLYEADGKAYLWQGTYPKVVPAASSPATAGGVSATGWLSLGDTTLRNDLANVAIGDALISVKSSLPNSTARTQHSKNADSISILDFSGADPTGSVDSTVALVSAMVSGRTVHIPSGVNIKVAPTTILSGYLVVDGTLTIDSTCSIDCAVAVRSGTIHINTGCTATFRGSFAANPGRRIFTGAGTVWGIRHVHAEWWGAVADGTTDNAGALNAASACVNNSVGLLGETRPTIELMSGRYRIASTWTLPSSANIGVEVKGQGVIFAGSRIVAASSFTGTSAIVLPGASDPTQRVMDFRLRDFGVVPEIAGSGPTVGITIGSTGNMIVGLKESAVSDVHIENFTKSLRIVNTRLVKFERVSMWNDGMTTASDCLFIESQDKFCGDLTFHNCQLVNKQSVSGSRGIVLDSSGTFVSTGDQAYHIAGIRFTECVIYPAERSMYISATNGAHIDDIFMSNCQWDGDSSSMVWAVAGVSSQINDIQIVNNYMYGGNKTSDAQVQFLTNSTGKINNIRVTGNTLGNGTGRAVNFTTSGAESIYGVTVSDNHIVNFNNTSAPAIEFGGGCSRFVCNNNLAMRTSGAFFPYLVQINVGCNYYIVTGNMGVGIVSTSTVREPTPGANRVVANNL